MVVFAIELQPVVVKLVWSRVLDAVTWILGASRDLLRWVEADSASRATVVYKETAFHPNSKTVIQNPFKFSSPLYPPSSPILPHPQFSILCQFPCLISTTTTISRRFSQPSLPHNMSNASFRLESFRPWNPFRTKPSFCEILSIFAATQVLSR